MKKTIHKCISLLLVCMMLFSVMTSIAFAASEDPDSKAITFHVKKVSETSEALVLDVELVSGAFVCVEFTATTSERLSCTAITTSDGFMEFQAANSGILFQTNLLTQKVAIISLVSYSKVGSIVRYTFSKNESFGAVADDVTIAVSCCYDNIDDLNVNLDTTVTTDLSATHTHTNDGMWVITKEATCQAEGVKATHCTVCGEVVKRNSIPKKEHKQVTTTVKATCTEDGYVQVVCETCKQVLSYETLSATGHQHTKSETTNATCEKDGVIKEICTDCGAIVHTFAIKSPGHLFLINQQDATCTEDGYTETICSECGLSKGDHTVIKAKGHRWSSWKTVKEATYKSNGLKVRSCSKCNAYEEKIIPMIAVKPKSISISMEAITMNYKKSTRLYANVLPEEAAYSTEIVWESSNPAVATVDEDGNVYAAGIGTATITASTADGSCSAKCQVTVEFSFFAWLIDFLFGWLLR